jgi:uncharacterized protein YycO
VNLGNIISGFDRFFKEIAMAIRLDPGAGGRSIGTDALQISDLIVSTASGIVSAAIRTGTLSYVSHASLYIGYDQLVEAVGKGVMLNNIYESMTHNTLAVAYRYPNLDEITALKIRDYVGVQLDKGYNYAGIAAHGCLITGHILCAIAAREMAERSDKFFCSQLVLAAYESVGIKLTTTSPLSSSPADIPHLRLKKKLIYVGHIKA